MRLSEVILILGDKKDFSLKPESSLKEVTSMFLWSPGTVGQGSRG